MKRIWPAPTSYWDALQDVLHLFCLGHSHSHANSLATPFLLLPPPHFAVTRAGKLLSRGKVPAAQVSWPKAEACIHTTCSMPLLPMSTPAMAGYSSCSRRVKSVQVVLSCSSHRPPTDTSERQDARSQPCSSLQPRAPHCSICWWGKVGWHCCPPLFLLLLTPHYKDQWSEVLPEEQLPQPWDKKLSGWWLWQLLSLNERFWLLLEKTGSSEMDVHAHTKLGSGKARPLTLPGAAAQRLPWSLCCPHTPNTRRNKPHPHARHRLCINQDITFINWIFHFCRTPWMFVQWKSQTLPEAIRSVDISVPS